MKKSSENVENYFIGLDVGTDSVGYAVTDENYKLVKYNGEPMWGSTTFEAAGLCGERRGFRTARRRLNRRQQRVLLIQELFAKEISRIDCNFYKRIAESKLYKEDKSNPDEFYVWFNDENYTDKDYYSEYPTIHHLIKELMESKEPHDVRLVYIACAWLVAHRGHFLSDVSKDNIDNILDFEPVYESFERYFAENDIELPWNCEKNAFSAVLKKKTGVNAKEKEFYALLFNGKKPKETADSEYPFNKALLIKLLCGGKVKIAELMKNNDFAEIPSLSLGMADEEFMNIIGEIGDDSEIILKLKSLYDWAVLTDVLKGKKSISDAKVEVYNTHKEDLRKLKSFIKKYLSGKYDEIFKKASKSLNNYPAYSKHFAKTDLSDNMHNAKKEDFSDYLRKMLKEIECSEEDKSFYDDMMERLTLNTFLPKQVDGDNRVIPYQLYWHELRQILTNASSYLPFLNEKDKDGISTCDKILSVFEFKIPYYVGPLSDKHENSWIVRKAEGKIYPWNFEKMVDLDKSEQEFIKRMTNKCSYLPGENVLPKNSLVYTAFEVLNQINNIKINGDSINVNLKQKIYNELFMKNPRVTASKLKKYMISNNIMTEGDIVSGIDMEGGNFSSLKPYIDFRKLIESGCLTYKQVEEIIEHNAYSEDNMRFKKWIEKEYSILGEKDVKYISTLKYKNFGRLSKKLLCELNGECKETGERATILNFMWSTNENLMQLLSERYTFAEKIENIKKEYYSEHSAGLIQTLDEMYISNSVKRPIIRTIDILDDIISVMGKEPTKVFIEMARGANEEQKNKRTSSRKEQIKALYEKIDTEDVRRLSNELEQLGDTADNQLQSEVLFLYFMQLGKCMYTGKNIDINALKTSAYNVDHIYPRCFVKDDSIQNNKVLVCSEENGIKSDNYPVPMEWRTRMSSLWYMLNKNGLITDEKYKRLVRSTPFSNEEKMGFINRQLVETRQSTKALATVITDKFKNCSVVYVKAGLVSDFRHEFDRVKCRRVNDLHHAKDAYLNIVVGNVYNEHFTKNWFKVTDKYTLNLKVLFENEFVKNGKTIWEGEKSLGFVKKSLEKNNIHFTRYAFCRKGGLFDQQPVKASEGLVPLKAGLDTARYGGYNKSSASFFVLAMYNDGKKKEIMIMPVELMHSKRFVSDEAFKIQYTKQTISHITKKQVKDVSFPMGGRILKINTVFSLDGFLTALGSKVGGGRQLGLIPLVSLKLSYETEKYIKAIEKFVEKRTKNPNMIYNEKYDKISAGKNAELYNMFKEKFSEKPYSLMPNSQYDTLCAGEEKFNSLDIAEQANVLMNILLLFKTGRTGGVNLCLIGGSENTGVISLSSMVSNWKKKYSDVRIIDVSASGIYEKCSENLLELL